MKLYTVHVMEVSAILYECTYCFITLYGRIGSDISVICAVIVRASLHIIFFFLDTFQLSYGGSTQRGLITFTPYYET